MTPIYFLPRNLLSVLRDRKGRITPQTVDNLSLLLDRFAPFVKGGKEKTAKTGGKVLKDVLGEIEIPESLVRTYRVFYNRYKEGLLKSIKAEWVVLTTKSRLVVGLGDESIYETSIRLLRNYGVPYIPGSAIKGVTRAWSIEMLAELLEGADGFSKDFFERAGEVQELLSKGDADGFPDKAKVPSHASEELNEFLSAFGVRADPGSDVDLRKIVKDLVDIFGTQDKEGSIVFFDALPDPDNLKSIFEWDIMNPHYGPYYQQNDKPPGDWYDPVPVIFLTVKSGVEFLFAVAQSSTAKKDLKRVAQELMVGALKYHGVGAKTSLGYGRFKFKNTARRGQ
ncbi:type III-B CRISPR module RAMP protein Cmr6 [Pyrococcus kukulkanii]|uniref:type III-B CRISPR module RAMP protein Cmr6 n=1 Tax=Pyrococcus kukulkanii TaxID=1609559 RepID=UPI003569ECB0